jgi:uncharacterized membrane protein YcgQ (UPF0703/DUF1980 family)
MLFAGIIASYLVAIILSVYKNYTTIQITVGVLASAACIWCLGQQIPANLDGSKSNMVLLIASWIVFGFLSTPLIPITLEHAAEITYPIPADNSAALLFFGVNTVCLAVTLGITSLLTQTESTSCNSIVTPASGLIFLFMLLGAALPFGIKPNYKRKQVEERQGKLENDSQSNEDGASFVQEWGSSSSSIDGT